MNDSLEGAFLTSLWCIAFCPPFAFRIAVSHQATPCQVHTSDAFAYRLASRGFVASCSGGATPARNRRGRTGSDNRGRSTPRPTNDSANRSRSALMPHSRYSARRPARRAVPRPSTAPCDDSRSREKEVASRRRAGSGRVESRPRGMVARICDGRPGWSSWTRAARPPPWLEVTVAPRGVGGSTEPFRSAIGKC